MRSKFWGRNHHRSSVLSESMSGTNQNGTGPAGLFGGARVALITEGTYPFHAGGVSVWCDQLVRGLEAHEFEITAIVGHSGQLPTWDLPKNVRSVQVVPLWGPSTAPRATGSIAAAVAEAFGAFAQSLGRPEDLTGFADSVQQLVELSVEHLEASSSRPPGTSTSSWKSCEASAPPAGRWSRRSPPRRWRTPGERSACCRTSSGRSSRRCPRSTSATATANGLSVLPALRARWLHGTPLVISEHGIYLRERFLSMSAETYPTSVRSVLLNFFSHLTALGYREAHTIVPGSNYNRSWQELNGGESERIHTIYNGVDPAAFEPPVGEPEVPTVAWLGRIDPLKDVETLLRAFVLVRSEVPEARLRIYGSATTENRPYLERCEELREELAARRERRLRGPVRDGPGGLPLRARGCHEQHLGGFPVHPDRGDGLRDGDRVDRRRRGARGGGGRRSGRHPPGSSGHGRSSGQPAARSDEASPARCRRSSAGL